MTPGSAVGRARGPGPRLRAASSVADPSRGTRVAVGIPLAAVGATIAVAVHSGVYFGTSIPTTIGLLAIAAVAARIVVQVGPRSWYSASTPAVVLAALLGGPFVGLAAGISTQLLRQGDVWRRRSAQGGMAALEGLAAAVVGASLLEQGRPTAAAVGAMLAAVVVNSVGRLLIMLERRTRPLSELWRRGIVIDLVETAVAVPLLSVLLIANDESEALVVATMASMLAVLTIAQRSRETTAKALEAEQENARRDQLTGAPNRRAFQEAMAAEHARIVRGTVPAGLFVIDLDHFKSVNDRFGHGVGDEVLVEVVRILTDGLRPADVVARWGGEEITVLAPGVHGRRQLEQFGERIRTLVGELPIATSTTALSLTVSVGGTLLDGSVPPTVALERADGALYDAKRRRDTAAVSFPPRLTLRLKSA